MNRSRPLLVGNVRGRWQELGRRATSALRRGGRPWSVVTDGLSPQQVVDRIVQAVDEEAHRE